MAWNNVLGGILGVAGAAAAPFTGGLSLGEGAGLGSLLNSFGPSPQDQMGAMESDVLNRVNGVDMPYYNEMMQSATQPVNLAFNKAQRGLVAQLAGSGLGKSGVGAAALNDLQAKRGQSLTEAETGVNEENLRWKQTVLGQLLGLGNSGIGMENQANLMQGQGLGGLLGTYLMRYSGMGDSGGGFTAPASSWGNSSIPGTSWKATDTWNGNLG